MSLLRVLFVDDEVAVLEGLENLLRKQRREWEMTFASSGEAALAELDRHPVDVVVSDMRMPGMDGATLLQHVQARCPGAVRIVLSGYAERGAVMRSLPVAQQFLSKPCDADALIAAVGRACRLQALLQSETLRRVAGRLETLPSAPKIYAELTQAMAQDDITSAKLARIIESDPAMVGKTLQLVNSAYFGLARRVTSVDQAVTYLGIEVLKGLVLNAHVFQMASFSPTRVLSLDRLQAHSLLVARLAGRVVKPILREVAFAAGIVHDVGKIVLASGVPDQFDASIKLAAAEKCAAYEAEQAVLGVTHAEMGAYLLGTWGLPFELIEAVAYHHTPGTVTSGNRDTLAAVHTVDALVSADARVLDMAFLADAGFAGELARWQHIISAELVDELRTSHSQRGPGLQE
jgi:HD-like signal output (HDOD) protein